MYLVGISARSPEPHSVNPHPAVLAPPGQVPSLENTVCQGPQGWGDTETTRPPLNRVPGFGAPAAGSNTSDSMKRPIPGFQLMPARGVKLIPGAWKTGVAALGAEHHAAVPALPQKYSQLFCCVSSLREPRSRLNPGTSS